MTFRIRRIPRKYWRSHCSSIEIIENVLTLEYFFSVEIKTVAIRNISASKNRMDCKYYYESQLLQRVLKIFNYLE